MPPLELSFASDVRLVRRIAIGVLAFGLLALGWTLFGDPTAQGNGNGGLVAGWVGAIFFGGLAPLNPGFGSRHDLKPLRRILGSGMFTHGVGVPPPAFSTGESLPEVDEIEAALAAFSGDRFRGVTR
ncbi:MAG: hypothetical protein ABWX74_17445 [Aeromicrobium sp.]